MSLLKLPNENIPLTWGRPRQCTNLGRLTWDPHVKDKKANENIPLTWELPRQCTNLALGENARLTWDPHVTDTGDKRKYPLDVGTPASTHESRFGRKCTLVPLTWGLPRQCTNLALGGNGRLT